MNQNFYSNLVAKALKGQVIDKATCRKIISSEEIDIVTLLNTALKVRHKYFKNKVLIHILNNAQNGLCSEDCFYCAQSKSSKAKIEKYSFKSDAEVLNEAKEAYSSGAYRYCVVLSGRSPSLDRIKHIAALVKKIKSLYKIEVCVSPGIINEQMARILKRSGLDRINHNINTAPNFYHKICTTHSFQDRINTLKAAKKVGLNVCSGVIIGMGESIDDIIEMALTLRKRDADSIPVNFFIPLHGLKLKDSKRLTPEFCLRVLCLFRLFNPKADIRLAAGREIHLKEKQYLGLYPATSLFLEGYLNARGDNSLRTLQMIKDAGFTIKSDKTLDELIKKVENRSCRNKRSLLKTKKELRPMVSDTVSA